MISQIQSDLGNLCLDPTDIVMIHASMRRVGCRAEDLLDALLGIVQEHGALMAYVYFEKTPEYPYFHLEKSPAVSEYGIFAEILRRHPEAIRSTNPGASVAAIGEKAQWLCADQPMDYGYGVGSPFHKLVQTGGRVVLLGSEFNHVTLLHYAEHVAEIPNKRIVRNIYRIWTDNGVHSLKVKEFDTGKPVINSMPENYFEIIVCDFIKQHPVVQCTVGKAPAWVLPADQLVKFAVDRMCLEYGSTGGIRKLFRRFLGK